MTYSKPEVVELNSALKAIQGFNKPPSMFHDNVSGAWDADIGAYEADE